jgi:hypothetical protein
MTEENTSRNKRLVKDRDSGLKWHELAKIYGISFTQARRIYLTHSAKYSNKEALHE